MRTLGRLPMFLPSIINFYALMKNLVAISIFGKGQENKFQKVREYFFSTVQKGGFLSKICSITPIFQKSSQILRTASLTVFVVRYSYIWGAIDRVLAKLFEQNKIFAKTAFFAYQRCPFKIRKIEFLRDTMAICLEV